MEGQISDEIKSERFSRLLEVQNRISLENNQNYIGKTFKVLVEGISKTDETTLSGRNEHNRLIHFKGGDSLTGSFAYVKVTSADTYSLNGILLNDN
jgi:tRNA-2-methylthio-N6-dimethylallyladenosine synthase